MVHGLFDIIISDDVYQYFNLTKTNITFTVDHKTENMFKCYIIPGKHMIHVAHKLIFLDYDKKLMIMHDSLPKDCPLYQKVIPKHMIFKLFMKDEILYIDII